jgi:hypothetical protein
VYHEFIRFLKHWHGKPEQVNPGSYLKISGGKIRPGSCREAQAKIRLSYSLGEWFRRR